MGIKVYSLLLRNAGFISSTVGLGFRAQGSAVTDLSGLLC